jgi:hypothetical protein
MRDYQTMTRHGIEFAVKTERDDNDDAPWDREDGHGPVRHDVSRGGPQPERGEVVLHSDRWHHWYYNFGASLLQAAREGWGLSDSDKANLERRLGRKPTRSQIRAEAVRQDESHLRRWLRSDWCYVGVTVAPMVDGSPDWGDGESLWGIESDCEDDIKEVANDLAGEIAHRHGWLPEQRLAAWRGALREARERRYWAQRDVTTVGP